MELADTTETGYGTTKGGYMSLREARKARGLTAKYVAEKLGIKPESLTRKERENRFNALQVYMLCELYNVRPEELNI